MFRLKHFQLANKVIILVNLKLFWIFWTDNLQKLITNDNLKKLTNLKNRAVGLNYLVRKTISEARKQNQILDVRFGNTPIL